MSKNEQIQFFWLRNVFSSHLNVMNLKLFRSHGGIYRFEKKSKKYSGEMNPLGLHRNIRGRILGVNSEGLMWESTICLFTNLTWGLRHSSKKMKQQKVVGVDFEIGDKASSGHLYWRLKEISCGTWLLSCFFLVTKK